MIAARLIEWQHRHGRHDLPWQGSRDPYRIWLSEIMLQQTRVSTVLQYFPEFVARFPDLHSLAAADRDDVLAAWSGLGYYGRARNLHRCAVELVTKHGGVFPSDPAALEQLPGIGRSTAAAIAVFAWGRRAAILDGNVRRVLARHAGVRGCPTQPAVAAELWRIAATQLPHSQLESYTQGLMDLGATICTRARPQCHACPLADDCVALRENAIAEIPAPRPRIDRPLRRCVFLVVRDADNVLVEKRPAAGIWGGLWSLPEATPDEDPARVVEQRFALRGAVSARLPTIEHDFTHLRLRARPLVVECAGATRLSDPGSARWLPLADAARAALPAPVKALLVRLADDCAVRRPDGGAGTGGSATAA